MSDCIESSSRDASCDVKPKHVRRLKFGKSILELDVAKQHPTSDSILVIDQNIAHIPCTEKRDYVRTWLETHRTSDELSQSSPILGSSLTETSEKSPILASSRKRPRKKIGINRHAIVKTVNNVDSREKTGHSANCTMQSRLDYKHEERNESQQECLSKTQCTPPCVEKVADKTSPVLSTHCRKKRRKLQHGSDGFSPKCLKLRNKVTSTNINPIIELDNNHSILRKITTNYKLKENLDGKVKTLSSLNEPKRNLEKYRQTFLSLNIQDRSNFEDSSSDNTDKNIPNIEINTSSDSQDSKDDEFSNTQSSSNNDLSNFIEDIDTQETAKTSQLSILNKSLIPSKQSFTFLQLATNDLDNTYSSETKMIQYETSLSAKISQVSFNKTTQKTDSKSIQTDAIISTITTPSKKSPDRSIYAHLLYSGKKRRRPKKGSMVAKLQSLINAQISGIRIWRHRMNKKHDDTSARFISVFVYNSIKQFGNQFLEGTLIEDPFNLLQCDVEIEEAESHDVQAQPKEPLYRNITIMLVCDIVGTLKMMSEVVINVYPPWDILNKDNLTLGATYISINDNCEVPDIIKNKDRSHKCKKLIVKEFTCPCIEERREFPFCARKLSNEKPDVMQQIFDS